MGIPLDGTGKIAMGWDRQICSMDNPGKNICWHISCYFLRFSGIFSISAISCLVIRCDYPYYILAVEVNNSTKVTLLWFNTMAVFMHAMT